MTESPVGELAPKGREAELMEQALALFSEVGYTETSLQEITARLGITRPLFYYYFDSKEDLLWRLIGHLGDDLLDRARPIAASAAPPPDRLRLIFQSHAELLLENAQAFRIYFAEHQTLSGKRKRSITRGEHAYAELIGEIVAAGQARSLVRPGSPRLIALLGLGLLNSMLAWYSPAGKLRAPEVAELAVAMALDSMSLHLSQDDRPPS